MWSSVLLAALLWVSMALTAPRLPAGATEAPTTTPLAGRGRRSVVEECQRTCGDVYIPYPFGLGPAHCSLSPAFNLDCKDAGNGVFEPSFATVQVLNISLQRGQVRMMNYINWYCYDAAAAAAGQGMDFTTWSWNLTGTVYTYSDTANTFVVIGCRTLAFIGNQADVGKYMTGCAAMCRVPLDQAVANGSCSGMGCCQTAIPRGLQYYEVWFDDRWNTSEIYRTSPCSYAVLMESSQLVFSSSYVTTSEFNASKAGRAPMVLDWAVGDQNCDVARATPGYACVSSNSECLNAACGRGYICNCTPGFQGNPYLTGPDGCQDINECDNPLVYGCHGDCVNRPGTFVCSCPPGTRGNASIEPCLKQTISPGARWGIGIVAGVLVCLAGFLAREVIVHKRSIKRQAVERQSDRFFQQHGGQLLAQMLRSEGNDNAIAFYNREDIMKATGNFDKANMIGEGGQGKVYKAILAVDGVATAVAVKQCKEIAIGDESRKEEFLQELVILCRVSHPNIVKLLGCCLQLEAPVLVYELAQHGTLEHLLRGTGTAPAAETQTRRGRVTLTLAARLRIAAEAAMALAHLHAPPHPILHGDVKPANILLGHGGVAKVSDFGCSTIDHRTQVVPKGTLAYLDPEFLLNDFQLSSSNDVYSFGVVLLELLTGMKPQAKGRRNLTALLHESMRDGTLGEILDAGMQVELDDEETMAVVCRFVDLVTRCIAVPGETRPAMGQVAQELRRLSEQVPERAQTLQDEELHSLGGVTERRRPISSLYIGDNTTTTGFSRLESHVALSAEFAR